MENNVNDILEKIIDNDAKIEKLVNERDKLLEKSLSSKSFKIMTISPVLELFGVVLFIATLNMIFEVFLVIVLVIAVLSGGVLGMDMFKLSKKDTELEELRKINETLKIKMANLLVKETKQDLSQITQLNEAKTIEETKQESQFEQIEDIEYETPVKEEKGRQLVKKLGVKNGK